MIETIGRPPINPVSSSLKRNQYEERVVWSGRALSLVQP
jgi:hypothetical protein